MSLAQEVFSLPLYIFQCDNCEFHEEFFDDIAFDGCLCNNKKSKMHLSSCGNITWGIKITEATCIYFKTKEVNNNADLPLRV